MAHGGWNKGLTKETDIRVAVYATTLTGKLRSPEQCNRISVSLVGKHHSKKHVEKQRIHMKKAWSDPNSKLFIVHWKGGISKYPFEFNKKLKKQIRERDHSTCQLCSKTEEKIDKRFPIHHINYDKNDSFKLNLIVLCNSCNVKVNFNKELWEDYFTYLLIFGISK